ncbi:MAG: DUF4058 family protein, partial [Planctomycetia bacterium]|nr:DUF4058 family protein [Planctomycetia bacterium]
TQQLRPKYVGRFARRVYRPEPDDPVLDFYLPTSFKAGSDVTTLNAPRPQIRLIDTEFRESRVEIIEVANRKAVTVIEVASPSNKMPGSASRKSYLEKRQEIMRSPIHWVEIDLLRGKTILERPVYARLLAHDYCVHVSTVEQRPKGRIWTIRLEDRLPVVGIPLRAPDEDVPLDLQAVLATTYDRAGYDLTIDYTRDPKPPLSKAQAAWAKKRLPKRRRKS